MIFLLDPIKLPQKLQWSAMMMSKLSFLQADDVVVSHEHRERLTMCSQSINHVNAIAMHRATFAKGCWSMWGLFTLNRCAGSNRFDYGRATLQIEIPVLRPTICEKSSGVVACAHREDISSKLICSCANDMWLMKRIDFLFFAFI